MRTYEELDRENAYLRGQVSALEKIVQAWRGDLNSPADRRKAAEDVAKRMHDACAAMSADIAEDLAKKVEQK
jgi:cell division septum initiation protein DivIVA